MVTEKFKEVANHEGVVSIVTWAEGDVHIANTWNSYLTLVSEDTFLIPAAGMAKTEENLAKNPKVKLTLGSKEVIGTIGPGAGFSLEAVGSFLDSGAEFDMMKEKFSFINRVLQIKVTSLKQTI